MLVKPESTDTKSSTSAACAICAKETARYTCPRCKTKSCSAVCSKKHKESSACSGQRDKTAYIKPTEYGYGQLMDDFRYLEEIGRFISDTGRAMQQDMPKQTSSKFNKGKGRAPNALEWVRKAEEHGLRVILLGEGMERRKLNQSKWNKRFVSLLSSSNEDAHPYGSTQTLFLTMTFKLHLDTGCISLTTHNNPANSSPADLLNKPLTDGRASKALYIKQVKQLKEAIASNMLNFLVTTAQDPNLGYHTYEIPREPSPEPEEQPPSQQTGFLHPSLPPKPVFDPVAQYAVPITIPTPSIEVPLRQHSSQRTQGLVKRPLYAPQLAAPPPAEPLKAEPEALPLKKRQRVFKEPQAPIYTCLQARNGLLKQLHGHTVIEWPIIEVYFPGQLDLEVARGSICVKESLKEPVRTSETQETAPHVLGSLMDYGTSSDEEAEQVAKDLLPTASSTHVKRAVVT